MARKLNSDINYTSIDSEYPVAGKDNDSQGFRDNFSYIKNNFDYAKTEIEDLLASTIRNDEIADFNDQDIINANLSNYTEKELSIGSVSLSSAAIIDFYAAPYQSLTIAGDNVQLTLINFPNSGKLGKVRIELTSDGNSRTVTLGTRINTNFIKHSSVPATIKVTSNTVPVILDFWTYDNGSTIFVDYIHYRSRSENFYSNTSAITTSTATIDYSVAEYQNFIVANNVTFNFSNFPESGRYGKMRVQLFADGTTRTVIFSGNIKKDASTPSPITLSSSTNPLVFDVWTYDNGNTIFIKYLGSFS